MGKEMRENVYVQSDYKYLMYVLDEVYDSLKSTYLETSVLGPVRLYSAEDSVDREFWALSCALIDFQVPVMNILNPMVKGLISWMEEHDIKFIHLIHNEELARSTFSSFQWSNGRGVKGLYT
ncbi:MAG: hypothetical protein QXM73_03240 [Candidatus Nezhaarchaeales archaeon]